MVTLALWHVKIYFSHQKLICYHDWQQTWLCLNVLLESLEMLPVARRKPECWCIMLPRDLLDWSLRTSCWRDESSDWDLSSSSWVSRSTFLVVFARVLSREGNVCVIWHASHSWASCADVWAPHTRDCDFLELLAREAALMSDTVAKRYKGTADRSKWGRLRPRSTQIGAKWAWSNVSQYCPSAGTQLHFPQVKINHFEVT